MRADLALLRRSQRQSERFDLSLVAFVEKKVALWSTKALNLAKLAHLSLCLTAAAHVTH